MKLKFYSVFLVFISILISSTAFGLERGMSPVKQTFDQSFSKVAVSDTHEGAFNENVILADESKDHEGMEKKEKMEKKKNKKKSKMKKKKASKKAKKKNDKKHDDLM